jgi:4-amino-4-deoxy-L-arabinose transferase-like glycosyltransferase
LPVTATTERPTAVERSHLAPLARAVLLVAAAKTAFFLAIANVWGIHRDEFYYLAGGRRLDWGYVDHPPVTPLLYRIGDIVFGSSQFGLHTIPALLAGVLVVVAALLARELGGGRTAQVISAMGVAVAPMFLTTSHFTSTVTVDILLWSIGLLAFARLLRTRDERLWLALGAIAGVGLLNKNTMVFWAIGVAGGLLFTKDRSHLRSRWLIGGIAIAGLAMLPYLLWQAQYDWPTVEFLRSLQSHTDDISNPVLYFPFQLVLLGPVLTIIWIPGLLWLLRSDDARRFRAIGVGYLVVLVLLFVLRGKAYYVGSWYPALFAAGSVRLESIGKRSLRTYVTILAVAGLTSAPFALPLVPSDSSAARSIADQNGELGEMIGWDDMAQQVAGVAHSLPAAERAQLTILTENYSEAGAIEYWRSSLDVPQPIARQNSYWLWGFGPAHENGTVIAVGFARSELTPFFSDIQLAGNVTNDEGIHNKEFGAEIVICRGQRVPWSEIWPKLKQFN